MSASKNDGRRNRHSAGGRPWHASETQERAFRRLLKALGARRRADFLFLRSSTVAFAAHRDSSVCGRWQLGERPLGAREMRGDIDDHPHGSGCQGEGYDATKAPHDD